MIYVFIDANMFLKMYSYDYNLDNFPLKDLIELIDDKEIKLILTQQVIDEVSRNRESMLKTSLNKVKQWKEATLNMPSFCENMKLTKLIKKLSKKVYNELFKDSKNKNLKVDKLFQEIISKSEIIPISEEIIKEAKERFDRGNPPGKKGSYGDCINWSILLSKIPKNENLYFIGVDKDFISPLDNETFSGFLNEEWLSLKKSQIIFYKSISKFLKEEFEEVEITEDQIKKEESVSPSPYPKIYSALPTMSGSNISTGSTFQATSKSTQLPSLPSLPDFSELPKPQIINPRTNEIKCPLCNNLFSTNVIHGAFSCPHCGGTFIRG